MAKQFKTKKMLRKLSIIRYILLVVLVYLLIKLCIYSLTKISPNNYYYPRLLIIDYYNLLKDNTINNPVQLLNYRENSFKIVKEEKNDEVEMVYKDTTKLDDKKKVYIYSTHQTEMYADKKSVVNASNYFKECLENENIEVVVEKGSIEDFLIANNYSYNYSYIASRYFIEEEIKNNDYNLIIDLHRDAVKREASLATINDKKYAKIMFVIGKKNKNYKNNYQLAEDLNNLIKEEYPNLTRGILLQDGDNVNGIYNQDLASNIILIELGGNNNKYEEVKNTLDLIAPIIGEYLNEKEI